MPFLFSQNLRELRLKGGFTQESLARKSGLTKDHISKIERGEQKNPRHETIEALAKALGIDPARLLYGAERKTADDGAKPRSKNKGQKIEGVRRIFEVPVVGVAQAGRKGFFDDAGYPVGHGFQKIAVPENFYRNHPHAYGVRLEGDSMLPSLKAGWIVVTAPESSVENGNYVVARLVGGEVLVKEVSFQDSGIILLKSHNSRHDPIVTAKRDFQFLHKVALIVPK